ncbi:replication initiation protein [Oceanimonas sp. CHS3-5]|uniref:replication initiation protein n=1 Tax=Oceanimonas sp. CHS3-5 TaxID=3068186 RepID=UPI00273E1348|nr:replication initiation protein [Oceanimonas sp. CHS3-5]MDP5291687.1 replication initiation protein [Oceanimonas sp. CHS3-5]
MNRLENNTISLSNQIVNFTSMGIMERRILYTALSLINPTSEGFYTDYISCAKVPDFDFKYRSVIFSIDDFFSLWGLKSKNNKMEVERRAELLTDIKCNVKSLRTQDLTDGSVSDVSAIDVFECVEEADYGFIKMKFSYEFLPYLYNVDLHPKGYTTIPLNYLVGLKSETSFYFMRLFLNEVSLQKRASLKFNRRIDTLCKLLGVSRDINFRDFNAKILKIAVNEINKTQLINVGVNTIKMRCRDTNRPKIYKLEFDVVAESFHKRKGEAQDAKDVYENRNKEQVDFNCKVGDHLSYDEAEEEFPF